MKAIWKLLLKEWKWVAVLLFFASDLSCRAQQNPSSSSELEALQTEQRALAAQQEAILQNGGTMADWQAWLAQNSVRWNAQVQRAKDIAAATPAFTPPVAALQIPAGASPELVAFLNARQALQVQATAPPAALSQAAASRTASAAFSPSTQTALWQTEVAQAKLLSARQGQQPMPIPSAVAVIPSNASPALASFLQARAQLAHDQAQYMAAYSNSSDADRMTAQQQWTQQNQARFDLLRQQAQALSAAQ